MSCSAPSLTQSFLSTTSPPTGGSLQSSPVPARTVAPPETVNAFVALPNAQMKVTPEEIAARRRQLEAEKARLLELKVLLLTYAINSKPVYNSFMSLQQQMQQQPAGNDLSELTSAFGLQPAQPVQPAVQTFQPFGGSPRVPVAHQPPVATGSSTTDPWATGNLNSCCHS